MFDRSVARMSRSRLDVVTIREIYDLAIVDVEIFHAVVFPPYL